MHTTTQVLCSIHKLFHPRVYWDCHQGLAEYNGVVSLSSLVFIFDNDSLTLISEGHDHYGKTRQRRSNLMKWRCH